MILRPPRSTLTDTLFPNTTLFGSVAGEVSAGRNSGFLINLPHNTRMSGHASPLEVARKQITMLQAGMDWLAQLSRQGGFDCGWDLAGKYHAAATLDGERSLRHGLDQCRAWGGGGREGGV